MSIGRTVLFCPAIIQVHLLVSRILRRQDLSISNPKVVVIAFYIESKRLHQLSGRYDEILVDIALAIYQRHWLSKHSVERRT